MSLHDVTVIGAGIGGLTAALALSRIGRQVDARRAPHRFHRGRGRAAALADATRILGDLGLGQALAPPGLRATARRGGVRCASGREIGEVAQGA